MNQELLEKIGTDEETIEIVKETGMKFLKTVLKPLVEPSEESRAMTKNEKIIIYKSLLEKKLPPFKELTTVGLNLNSVYFIIEDRVQPLFSMFTTILNMSDEEICDFIDLLKSSNYDLNERTLYNGANLLLSCVLSFRPKTSKKLIELGVDWNVTNATLDTVYQATKDIAEYISPDIYDEILETRGLLESKQQIIDDYKELLKFLEEKNITNDIDDKMYTNLNKYIESKVKEHNLNKEEADTLKRTLYNTLITTMNNFASDIILKFPQYR